MAALERSPGSDASADMAAVRRKLAEDPDLQQRLREVREVIGSDEQLEPGITADQLPEFLRERG